MLTGEYNVTLDDMGRISLPRRLRDNLGNNNLVLRRCDDGCIWLFTADEWKKVEHDIVNKTNIYSSSDLALRRNYAITSVEIDKQGRIVITPPLRAHAGLVKECIVLGQFEYIEIWAEDRYISYLESSKEQYRAASEELSAKIKKEKDKGNGGDSALAGTAGANSGVPGAEGQP